MYRRKLNITELNRIILIAVIFMNIKKLREEKELLGKEVAKQIGVVESVYSEWENEKLSISTNRLFQLADFFETNIDYIVGISDNKLHIKSNEKININDVAIKIKEIRKSLNMTMRDLAEKLNTTSSAISNYENAKFLILSPFLIELCKLGNYSIDWVLGRSNEKYLK